MLVAALRRFMALLAAVAAVTALIGLGIGAAAGLSLDRSIAIGFYLVGVVFLVGGFVTGTRPPVRFRGDDAGQVVPWRARAVRWAELRELNEAINSSAVLVTVGLALVVLGVAVDSRQSLF